MTQKRDCPRCETHVLDETEYNRRLAAYISSLPDEIKTPPGEYGGRISICGNCAELADNTCLLCGCYIEMRAAKRQLNCPRGYW